MGMWTTVGNVAGGVIGGMFGGPAGAMVGSAVGGFATGTLSGEKKKEELAKSGLQQQLMQTANNTQTTDQGFDYSKYYTGQKPQANQPTQTAQVQQQPQQSQGGGILDSAMQIGGSFMGGGGASSAGAGAGGSAMSSAGAGGGMSFFADGGVPNFGRPAYISDAQTGQTTGMMNEQAPEMVVPMFGQPGNQQGSQQGIPGMTPGINPAAQEELNTLQALAPYQKQVFGESKTLPGEQPGTFQNTSVVRMEAVPENQQTLQPRIDQANQQEKSDFFSKVFGQTKNEFAGSEANYGDAARMMARGLGFYYDMRRERVGLGKSALTRWLDWNEGQLGESDKNKAIVDAAKIKAGTDLEKMKMEGWTPKEVLDDKGNKKIVYFNPRTNETRDTGQITGYKPQGQRTDFVDPKTGKITKYEYDPQTQQYKPLGVSEKEKEISAQNERERDQQANANYRAALKERGDNNRQAINLKFGTTGQKYNDELKGWFEGSEKVTQKGNNAKSKKVERTSAKIDSTEWDMPTKIEMTLKNFKNSPPEIYDEAKERLKIYYVSEFNKDRQKTYYDKKGRLKKEFVKAGINPFDPKKDKDGLTIMDRDLIAFNKKHRISKSIYNEMES